MMRFLVDQCLSPQIARALRDRGFDAVHVGEIGMKSADDHQLFALAEEQDRILITADSDFGEILALRAASKPSVILFREDAPAAASDIICFLEKNLPQLQPRLAHGIIAVVHASRIRIRELPIY